jgi:hypothetical protein
VRITYRDCVSDLVRGDQAAQRHRRWLVREQGKSPEYSVLQEQFRLRVQEFAHEHLFDVSPEAVRDVRKRTEHALGDLKKNEASKSQVEDFDTPFSLTYFFHALLEKLRRPPLWQEFWKALRADEWRRLYLVPLARGIGRTLTKAELGDAVQWRVGKLYYSCLRELYAGSVLRHDHGVELNYHLFADLVLKVDGWCGTRLVCFAVPNDFQQRKFRPPRIDGCEVMEMSIRQPSGGGYGKLWVPSGEQLNRTVAFLRGADATTTERLGSRRV